MSYAKGDIVSLSQTYGVVYNMDGTVYEEPFFWRLDLFSSSDEEEEKPKPKPPRVRLKKSPVKKARR